MPAWHGRAARRSAPAHQRRSSGMQSGSGRSCLHARRHRSQDDVPPESRFFVPASRCAERGYRPVRLAHASTSRRSHRSIPRSRLIGAGKSRSRTFHALTVFAWTPSRSAISAGPTMCSASRRRSPGSTRPRIGVNVKVAPPLAATRGSVAMFAHPSEISYT